MACLLLQILCVDDGIAMTSMNDLDQLTTFLDRFEPGFLPKPLFEAVARITVTPTFVVVPLFRRKGQTRALLTRREDNDTHYAGLLHPPGKIILASDLSLNAVFKRLIASELSHITDISEPVFVDTFFDMICRGREVSLVHYVSICDPGEMLETVDCTNLPSDVISTDVLRIARAAAAFEKFALT